MKAQNENTERTIVAHLTIPRSSNPMSYQRPDLYQELLAKPCVNCDKPRNTADAPCCQPCDGEMRRWPW